MIVALVAGSLFGNPESRTSKNGRPFVTMTIRVKDGDESRFVRAVAFSETVQSELMRLADGDNISIQGPFTASIYTASDGNSKISLSMVANHVLALRQAPKARQAKVSEPAPDVRSRQQRLAGSWQSPADGPSDDIPFGSEA
jgi:hypothetical protein